jgi:hypothetical protein
MANGAPFEFTQAEFDFIGSDLGTFPVAARGRGLVRVSRSC